MRVGIDMDIAAVDHSSSSVKFTAKVYTENQYSMNDGQTLSFGGAISGSTSFTNGAGGGNAVLRATKTYTYNYGSNEYGSSPGTRTFSANLSGAYNGVTPSKSVTKNIPARPIAAPLAPSGTNVSRVSDTSQTVAWTRNNSSGAPYDLLELTRWDNVSNSWSKVVDLFGSTSSWTDTTTSANRRYQYRVRAQNDKGWSAYSYSEFVQTTPASPTGATLTENSPTSLTVSWSNGAPGNGYLYWTEVEQSVNGGSYSVVEYGAEGVTAKSFSGLTAGNTYRYRVRHRSNQDGTDLYSGYSTTGTADLQSPPAAPTVFTATRTSDALMVLNWTNNPDVDAPYDTVTVQRWENTTATWSTVASLAGTANTLSVTTGVGNRKYQFRVRANNSSGSSAWATQADFLYTTPDAPINVTGAYTAAASIAVSWTNTVSYTEHSTKITPYMNGVAQTPQTVAAGVSSWTMTGAVNTSAYYFKVEAISTVGTLSSGQATSNTVLGSAAPAAPTNLAPAGLPVDFDRAQTLTWVHSLPADGSAQQKFAIRHKLSTSGTWTTVATVTSGVSSWTLPAGTYANGVSVDWQVQTWGVFTDPSVWSATATLTGSATPVASVTSPGATIPGSAITVSWMYYDPEVTPQAGYEVRLFDGTGLALLEEKIGTTGSTVTLDTPAIDGATYSVTVRVQDAAGLWSDLVTAPFTAVFLPPAEVMLSADYDSDSGAVVLTLNPSAADNVTTLPATKVLIERQVYDPEVEAYGDWEVVASDVSPTATIIDTTAPINDDGHYRVTTFSAAPSSFQPTTFTPPSSYEEKWLYVSGGESFDVVCRMWANIELSWSASKTKALHYFAGRKRPTLYSGPAQEKVLSVSGLITDDATKPRVWLKLAQTAGPVLLRAPGNRRIFGNLSEVSVDRVGPDLYRVSFSIQEVHW